MTTAPRVLASTTSHKKEPLLPTLDVFARLGLCALDLNLHHIIEVGTAVGVVAHAVAANGQRVWIVSGGWCDFFHRAPDVDETFRSVERQVTIASELGVNRVRLFFGRLKRDDYVPETLDVISANLLRLSDRYSAITFVFENHDGASLDPAVCRDVLARVDRPNIQMNFDPINFERAGVNSLAALDVVEPLIGHVHLKGIEHGTYCEFGTGDVNLTPVLRRLYDGGYRGQFTVEYEGSFDGTLRLYQSVRRAEAALAEIGQATRGVC